MQCGTFGTALSRLVRLYWLASTFSVLVVDQSKRKLFLLNEAGTRVTMVSAGALMNCGRRTGPLKACEMVGWRHEGDCSRSIPL